MNNEKPLSSASKTPGPVEHYSFTRQQLMIVGLAVLLIIAFFWIWKAVQVKSVKNDYGRREEALIQKTTAQVDETHRHLLSIVAKPYVWAVRTELMQGNTGQVNLYGNDIVKEKNFVSVMVANADGAIISSTDKKYEGKELKTLNPALAISADSTIVKKINDSLYMVSSPIMSFNSKLGTLIINYAVKSAPVPATNDTTATK